jgi:hypothetical protein
MDTTAYCENLGKLPCNLHGLEFALRAFLAKHNAEHERQANHQDFRVGVLVPEN